VEPYDPLFLPLSKLETKLRNRQFLHNMGKVLKLSWLKDKTPDVSELTLLPSCVFIRLLR